MAEDHESLLQAYREMRGELLKVIDGLSDELMTEPSLDGWSIKDHLAHLAFWDDIRASDVARISAGHDSAWHMTDEQDEAYNALAYSIRAGMPLNQVMWELDTSRRRLLDAIAVATENGMDASRYGAAGLRSMHEREHSGWIRRWRTERGV